MEAPRCMTWKEFKQSLDNMEGKRIKYIDEEGTEIPINTDAEFQEALRLAKRQGNRVRFIMVNEGYDEGKRSARQSSKPKEKFTYKDVKYSTGWLREGDYKEGKEAMYVNDVPPEWFLSYMKKFKKDFLAEVNNTINETIRKTFKKEARLYDERLAKEYEWESDMNCVGTQYYYRSENGYETPAYFVTSQPLPASGSVRVRSTEKVYLDQLRDERGSKQHAKMEKSGMTPSSDKRQKSNRWVNAPGAEEKQKGAKSRPYPKVYVTYVHDFGPMKPIKSASFTSNLSLKKLEVLQPYALWFLLGNNGSVSWSNNAFVKCFYNPDEFEFEDNVIDLPSLAPGVGANVVYEVTPLKVGSFSFTCAIIDGGVEIGERILCRFEVVAEEGMIVPNVTKASTFKKEWQLPCEHYDDEFLKTQKKIKENIKGIMKRLDDIECMNGNGKVELKKKPEDTVKVGQKRNRKKRKEGSTVEFRTGVFDVLQNLEIIRENEEGKPKDDDEKEIVKDGLIGAEIKIEVKENKKDKQEEEEKKNEEEGGRSDCNQATKDDSKKEAGDTERRDSDSELSVIMGSEEDDNFIVLSMPSRTPSPNTEVKEVDNGQDQVKVKDNDKEMEKERGKENDAKQKESPREEEKKGSFEGNTFDPWNEKKNRENIRFDPWNEKKSQPDPFDDTPKDNGNGRKKWGFHIFNIPEATTTGGGPQFCFVDSIGTPEEVLAKLKSNNFANKDGLFTAQDDKYSANVVFVVDKGGKIVPVFSGMPKEGAQPGKQKENAEAGKRQEGAEAKENKNKETEGEGLGGPLPETLLSATEQSQEGRDGSFPNLLLYNAASDAITKVASVFNNIQSTFLPGGTEKKTTGERSRQPLKMMEALNALERMGFTDKIRNRELLMVHNLNIHAVIEDLLDTTPSFREHQPTGVFVSKQGIFGRF